MMPEKKKRVGIRLFLLAGLLALLLRLWPVLPLIAVGLIIYSLYLCNASKKSTAAPLPPLPALPPPATEQSVLSTAFGLLQRRITDAVHVSYPNARWAWSAGNALARFTAGEPLFIVLNGAGGYREAVVRVCNLQFSGLVYKTAAQPVLPAQENDSAIPEPDEVAADYCLLAFEWVEANMQWLNTLGKEADENGQSEFRISAEDLPHGDGWPAVCKELIQHGFAAADVLADGIQVKIKTEEGA